MNINDKNCHYLLHAFFWGLKDCVQAEKHSGNLKTLHKATRMFWDFDNLFLPKKKFGWDWPKYGRKEKYKGNGSAPQLIELGIIWYQNNKIGPGNLYINKAKYFRYS